MFVVLGFALLLPVPLLVVLGFTLLLPVPVLVVLGFTLFGFTLFGFTLEGLGGMGAGPGTTVRPFKKFGVPPGGPPTGGPPATGPDFCCKNAGVVTGGGRLGGLGKNGTFAPLFIFLGVKPLLLINLTRFVVASINSFFVMFSVFSTPTLLAILRRSSLLVLGSNNRS